MTIFFLKRFQFVIITDPEISKRTFVGEIVSQDQA
jgi:hypothetical protein